MISSGIEPATYVQLSGEDRLDLTQISMVLVLSAGPHVSTPELSIGMMKFGTDHT
jgi:hypothetical protein